MIKLSLQKAGRLRQGLVVLVLLLAAGSATGCRTVSFYAQALKGQCQLVFHERSIERLLADPQTPAPLKTQLELLQALRAFAGKDLKLPVNGHYRKYVDVHRPYVVWNVEAAPEFSMEPKSWWYPLVGSLEYRGYFSERGATNYGHSLQRKGYDVYVDGVTAYSTLGWFRDPVLNTFVFEPESQLAETIFHELGHQRVFAHGDTDFNEAFATTVGEEGARRWLKATGKTSAYERYLAELRRTRQFVALISQTRQQLETLYGDQRTEGGRVSANRKNRSARPEELRRAKQQILTRLQEQYRALRASWGGESDYDAWFAGSVNNAQLNSVATYYDLVPGFERLLASNGGDLEEFFEAASRLAKQPRKERQQRLQALGQEGRGAG